MKRIRVTRQHSSWMRDLDIVSLKNNRRHLRYQCHQTNKDNDWQSFRKSRNELKSKIKSTKNHFTANHYHLNALKKFGQLYTEF